MMLSREATTALNDYLDQVRAALPLAPSHGLSLVDKLYRQITSACENKARLAHESQVSGEAMQAHIMTLGSPQECAERLALAEADRRWPGEAFTDILFERHGFSDRAGAFAKAAAQRGEYAARVSIDVAASAFDMAAQKLREAAEKMKSK